MTLSLSVAKGSSGSSRALILLGIFLGIFSVQPPPAQAFPISFCELVMGPHISSVVQRQLTEEQVLEAIPGFKPHLRALEVVGYEVGSTASRLLSPLAAELRMEGARTKTAGMIVAGLTLLKVGLALIQPLPHEAGIGNVVYQVGVPLGLTAISMILFRSGSHRVEQSDDIESFFNDPRQTVHHTFEGFVPKNDLLALNLKQTWAQSEIHALLEALIDRAKSWDSGTEVNLRLSLIRTPSKSGPVSFLVFEVL